MKTEPKDDGKPTCCAPGDLSACMIETTEERNETHPKADPPKKSDGINETNKGGKSQPEAAHEKTSQDTE